MLNKYQQGWKENNRKAINKIKSEIAISEFMINVFKGAITERQARAKRLESMEGQDDD